MTRLVVGALISYLRVVPPVSNKRLVPRTRRRMRVDVAGTPAFTVDVSPGGFCTEAMRVLPPGSPVVGKLLAPEGDIEFRGTIAWARPGDPRLQVRGRMGVRITNAPPAYLAAIASSR